MVEIQDRDRLLCPVRALRFYLNKVKEERGTRQRLFLPIKQGLVDISSQTISKWIVKVVKHCYESSSVDSKSLYGVKAHEVRALSASWALFNGIPFSEIMSAAFWRSNSTFTEYYLRSLAQYSDELFSLGPIVASQTVVRPPC